MGLIVSGSGLGIANAVFSAGLAMTSTGLTGSRQKAQPDKLETRSRLIIGISQSRALFINFGW